MQVCVRKNGHVRKNAFVFKNARFCKYGLVCKNGRLLKILLFLTIHIVKFNNFFTVSVW